MAKGDDVYDAAGAALGAIAGGALGKKLHSAAARKRYWPNAGKRSRAANAKQTAYDAKRLEKSARDRPDEGWLREEARKRRRMANQVHGRGGMYGGAAAGALGGVTLGQMARDRR